MTQPRQTDHDRSLAAAFDGQAARFERAPVQTDPESLARLVRFADLDNDSLLLDAGCGPGLVSRAFLDAGHRIVGVDLSAEMIERARVRCPNRATFIQGSIYETSDIGPFDASVSRYVLHHVTDPSAFLARQVELLKPGGILVLSDHIADPDPKLAAWHNRIEIHRDKTHTSNLSSGAIVDLFAASGLVLIQLTEELFTLDFDEWFDRGTPLVTKAEVRALIETAPQTRGFTAQPLGNGRLQITCMRMIVRGVKPLMVADRREKSDTE